ncbi:hypothetical protein HK102_006840 [Quaeritorhiza haematococci]|nr:hypothetical protein HK102_006840 [Quaeritorhiza haematococci]
MQICHQFFWPHLMELDANLDSKFSADYLVALLGYGHLRLFEEFVNYVNDWFQQHRGLSGLTVLRNLLSTVTATEQLVKILGGMVVETSGTSGTSGSSGISGSSRSSGSSGTSGTSGTSSGTSGSSRTSGTSGSSGSSGTSGRSSGRYERYTAAFILYLQKHGTLPDFATLGLQPLLMMLVTGHCPNRFVCNIEVFRFSLQHYVGNNSNGLIKGTKYFAKKCVDANFSQTHNIHTEEIGTKHDFLHLAMTHGLVGPDDLFSVLEEGIRCRKVQYVYYTVVYGVDFPSDSDFWLGMAKTLDAEERFESWNGARNFALVEARTPSSALEGGVVFGSFAGRG